MAEISEDDLLPGEISEDDLAPEPGQTSAKMSNAGGVKRLELHKTPAPDPDDTRPAVETTDDNPLSFLKPTSQLGALAHGISQGATLGFGDELMGGVSALSDVGDSDASLLSLYEKNRHLFRDDVETAEKSHPKTFLAGELVGGTALPMPGGAALKGAAKVKQFAKTGAKLGAAGGLGHSKGEIVGTDDSGPGLGTAARDTVVGGVLGGATGALLGKGADKLDRWLTGAAESRAYKALDPYMKMIQPMMRKRMGREPSNEEVMAELRSLGRTTLDSDAIPQGKLGRWATSETIAKNAARSRDEAGEQIGGYISHLDDTGGAATTSMEDIAASMEAKAMELAKDPSQLAVAKNLMREAETMRKSGMFRALGGEDPTSLSLAEAEKLKRGLQGAVYGVDAAQRGGPTQQAKEMAARLAKEASEGAIERSSGPDEVDIFRALKNKYGSLDTVADTAGYGAARNFRNNLVSLGDQNLAQVGAEIGQSTPEKLLGSALLGTANHIGRTRGSAAAARTLDNLSKSNQMSALPSLAPWSKFLEQKPKQKPEEEE